MRITDDAVSIAVSGRGVPYAEIERIAGVAKARSDNPSDGAVLPFMPEGLTLVVDQTTMPPNRYIDATFAPADDGVRELVIHVCPTSSMSLDQWMSARRAAPSHRLTQAEPGIIAKSATAPWTADAINLPALPSDLVNVEQTVFPRWNLRTTMLAFGSTSVSMNPGAITSIDHYAAVVPGTFTAAAVRVHAVYIVRELETKTLALVWLESPGLLVGVKTVGTDVAPLQRIAESLQPVSTDAWTKLLATVGAKPETVKAP